MSEAARSMTVVWGKACALGVLLMSFSGDISRIASVEYFQYPSFALCGAAAIVFLLLAARLKTTAARKAFGIVVLALTLGWCAMLAYLQWAPFDGRAVPAPLAFAFATCGRLATLFVNIQWNFHYSLNQVQRAGHLTAAATLLAASLFLASQLLAEAASAAFVAIVLTASCLLNLYLILREGDDEALPTSLASVEAADRRTTVSAQSIPKTRLLYFGARVAYGLSLGVLLCLVSTGSAPAAANATTVALCLMIAIIVLGLLWVSGAPGRKGCYEVVASPVLAMGLLALAFLNGNVASLFGLFAVFVELAWSTQNLFQLPAYRRMTGIDPAIFSYFEYAAQIIPYYFSVAAFLPMLSAAGPAQSAPLIEAFATVLFIVLMGFSLGAVMRHIIQYQPALPASSVPEDGIADDALAADFTGLTPREREVTELLATGYSRPYIAKTLYLADGTVKTHIKHIYGKLGVSSQDELIEYVRRNGRRAGD